MLAGKLVSWGAEELVEPEGWEKSPDEGNHPTKLVQSGWEMNQGLFELAG